MVLLLCLCHWTGSLLLRDVARLNESFYSVRFELDGLADDDAVTLMQSMPITDSRNTPRAIITFHMSRETYTTSKSIATPDLYQRDNTQWAGVQCGNLWRKWPLSGSWSSNTDMPTPTAPSECIAYVKTTGVSATSEEAPRRLLAKEGHLLACIKKSTMFSMCG
ncbi:uncharacterized protein F5Z01DRAFT_698331 [Emericellopsis atlantica]|uniref:Uncharacterized protein n=1 Tax=Emericellopsis atlantica TaxID=2614577 RepID=A0A9P7ZQC3_9HYPO|nr:uncharacterized protein F5Z01DRAFT_698331 [Emericellopsis atlantica]KAG9256384.1 hypothetical protein F5Z01DRAFT_698331 [Emericellopsis atlantica]